MNDGGAAMAAACRAALRSPAAAAAADEIGCCAAIGGRAAGIGCWLCAARRRPVPRSKLAATAGLLKTRAHEFAAARLLACGEMEGSYALA